jgi:Tol biopolymer transport system component
LTPREQQIRALFRAALERPAPERASFVAELTGDDVELRRSVELMLSSHDATDVGAGSGPNALSAELPAGTLVAHYRIEAVLGRGGMGIVYRATDTKLHRPVAIKFLSAAVPDAHVRRRFAQEAETTSGLNHPHIVTVFDVGEHEGQPYIVSELVDGGTLDEWAEQRRSRTWRQVVELTTGVADALAAAHGAGVLHRDVKPGNVLIGGNGYAKLADFGLAKLVGAARERGEPQASRNTRAGVVVGTVAYMSPEQAAGEPLDARSDVFSFGVVLYELLAGRPPFAADNELATLKSIAHATPAPLPDDVPEPLRAIVDKALEKAPADRYQTMQDLVVDLRRLMRRPVLTQTAGAIATERRRVRAWAIAAGALAIALAAALVPVTSYLMRPSPSSLRVRLELPVPGLQGAGLAVSPDGERIAYLAGTAGNRQIWVRELDSSVARALAGTEGANGVFFSPDGTRLGFNEGGELKTIDIAGGPANVVADYGALIPFGGAWNDDNTILFTVPDRSGAIYGIGRVSAVGGTPAVVLMPDAADRPPPVAAFVPRMLPDGERFLYLMAGAANESPELHVASLTSRDTKLLLSVDSGSAQAGTVPGVEYAGGFLLYRRNGTLLAQRFDTGALELRGEAMPLAESVAEFAASDDVLVYRPATGPDGAPLQRSRRLVWYDRSGQRLGELDTPPQYRVPVLSPDDRSVALSVGVPQQADVWAIDTQRGVTTRLTFHDASDDLSVWSPDSTRILFNSGRDGVPGVPSSLYERAANGTGPEQLLFAGGVNELLVPFDWSRDGRYVVFGRAGITTWQERIDLWTLEMTGERTASALIESPFRKETPKFSPDGRWIAYSSNEGGDSQIYVQPFPDLSRGKWTISRGGGREPRWGRDGAELFYLDPAGVLMAVDLRADGDRLDPGQPQPLFRLGFALPGPAAIPDYYYNVSADGQRFLINEPVTATAGAPASAPLGVLHVVVNWAEGLGAP